MQKIIGLAAELAKLDQQIAELQRQRAALAERIDNYLRMKRKVEGLPSGDVPGSQPSHLKFPVDVERAMLVPAPRLLERNR